MRIKQKRQYANAVRWQGNNMPELVEMGLTACYMMPGSRLIIICDKGSHIANVGDWIIDDGEGRFHPCTPSAFEKTWEPVL